MIEEKCERDRPSPAKVQDLPRRSESENRIPAFSYHDGEYEAM